MTLVLSPGAAWLARTHAACFSDPRPWTAKEFKMLLRARGTILVRKKYGFVLARAVLDEAEILTIAVLPWARRKGLGSELLAGLEHALLAHKTLTLFLEVADVNAPARALYRSCGFYETGRRTNYYAGVDGNPLDALILSKTLS